MSAYAYHVCWRLLAAAANCSFFSMYVLRAAYHRQRAIRKGKWHVAFAVYVMSIIARITCAQILYCHRRAYGIAARSIGHLFSARRGGLMRRGGVLVKAVSSEIAALVGLMA